MGKCKHCGQIIYLTKDGYIHAKGSKRTFLTTDKTGDCPNPEPENVK